MTRQGNMTEHWHYAMTAASERNPAVVETMVSPETNLDKKAAKRMLQPTIRLAQQHVRYPDPVLGEARLWEPADWWMHSGELVWLNIPVGANPIFAVYPCSGDCNASAVAHRDELAEYVAGAGLDVTVEPARKLN